MDKSSEYKQFSEIESKIYAFLNTHEISNEKSKMAVSTYNYIWELVEEHAKRMGLDTTKYVLWLIFRSLYSANLLPVEVEKRKCLPLTGADLEIPKEKRIYPKGEANGLKRYLKVFGTEQQQRILNS